MTLESTSPLFARIVTSFRLLLTSNCNVFEALTCLPFLKVESSTSLRVFLAAAVSLALLSPASAQNPAQRFSFGAWGDMPYAKAGDTHFFKFDKPLYSPTKVLPNFSRLQPFGSPLIHWVKVTVDPTGPEVFTVHPVMVRQ